MREGIAGWWQLKEYFFTAETFSVFLKLFKQYLFIFSSRNDKQDMLHLFWKE